MTTIEFRVTGINEASLRQQAEEELARVRSGNWDITPYDLDIRGTEYVQSAQGPSQVVLYEGTVRAQW